MKERRQKCSWKWCLRLKLFWLRLEVLFCGFERLFERIKAEVEKEPELELNGRIKRSKLDWAVQTTVWDLLGKKSLGYLMPWMGCGGRNKRWRRVAWWLRYNQRRCGFPTPPQLLSVPSHRPVSQ
jgi:hypothetical protein